MTLHEIEDLARYADPNSPKGRALARMYARKLNALWKGPVTAAEVVAHEARRNHPATGPDYFRARTIARNAIEKAVQAVRWVGAETPEECAALAVKAARAVRKVRPELFQEGEYPGVGL